MNITELKPQLIWNIFDQITKVPRPSKKEEKIRAWLLQFAKEHNLAAKTDPIGNVIMEKPATPGYENAPVVVLQGHMDMVCEKNNDVKHDFDNDPIQTIIEGEWVRANGTTLGADNGIGVAASLAVLCDNTLVHGPVQALFTVDEETGLTGAVNLSEGMLKGDILLNLDSEDEAQIFIGCAGGIDTTCHFKYEPVNTPAGYEFLKIEFKGMQGGHSGSDIDKGRANANKIMIRTLFQIMSKHEMILAEIKGGNLRNAIAREAHAVIGVKAGEAEAVKAIVKEMAAIFTAEFEGIENIIVETEAVAAPATIIDNKTANAVILSMYGCPHGVLAMSSTIPGLVETSTNLASVKMLEGNEILVTTSQRSSVESRKYDAAYQVESVFKQAGAEVTHGDGYPGWTPNVDSAILKTAIKAYEELYNITPEAKALHAGLECGYFKHCYPNLDMISFGPTLLDVHSPKERMHIPAVEKFWNHLVKILEMVAKGE